MTTTSRARREAVVDVLVRTFDVSEDGDVSFAAMADAALVAILPDRTVFSALLEAVIEWTREIGASDDIFDTTASTMRNEAVRQLYALVYGDDAQAGEVTG